MLTKNNRTFVKCVLIIWLVINVLELIELTAFILLLLNCSKWYIVIYVRTTEIELEKYLKNLIVCYYLYYYPFL
jgi:hypothetical protein